MIEIGLMVAEIQTRAHKDRLRADRLEHEIELLKQRHELDLRLSRFCCCCCDKKESPS